MRFLDLKVLEMFHVLGNRVLLLLFDSYIEHAFVNIYAEVLCLSVCDIICRKYITQVNFCAAITQYFQLQRFFLKGGGA